MKFIFNQKKVFFSFILIFHFFFKESFSLTFLANATKTLDNFTEIKIRHTQMMQDLIQNYSPEAPSFTLLLPSFRKRDPLELELFYKYWLDPLKNIYNQIYLCDIYNLASNRANIDSISIYRFEKEETIFISCYKYPDLTIQKWLANEVLPSIPNNKPIIFFFYYSPIGKVCNMWTENEKISFYELIKNHDVKALIVGHHDFSYKSLWNDIPVYSVGGKSFALFELTPEEKDLFVTFYSIDKRENENKLFLAPKQIEPLEKQILSLY